jgi:hypothetical protein
MRLKAPGYAAEAEGLEVAHGEPPRRSGEAQGP